MKGDPVCPVCGHGDSMHVPLCACGCDEAIQVARGELLFILVIALVVLACVGGAILIGCAAGSAPRFSLPALTE